MIIKNIYLLHLMNEIHELNFTKKIKQSQYLEYKRSHKVKNYSHFLEKEHNDYFFKINDILSNLGDLTMKYGHSKELDYVKDKAWNLLGNLKESDESIYFTKVY